MIFMLIGGREKSYELSCASRNAALLKCLAAGGKFLDTRGGGRFMV